MSRITFKSNNAFKSKSESTFTAKNFLFENYLSLFFKIKVLAKTYKKDYNLHPPLIAPSCQDVEKSHVVKPKNYQHPNLLH